MATLATYRLEGETPSKKNSRQVFRGGRNIPSKRYLEWFKRSEIALFRQGILVPAISCPIEVKMVFHHADERTRDTDNQVSSVLDLLKGIKIIKDDCWKIVRKISAEAIKDKESFVTIAIEVL